MSRKILKAYPHLEELNNYSLRILELIAEVYPTWPGYAQVAEFNGEKFLEIKIDAPIPTEHDLVIITEHDDLTVHFDWFHEHFGRWYTTPEEAFKHAQEFIDGVLNEDIIVGIKMQDGKWAGSMGFTPNTLNEIKDTQVTYTRSWNGTYNKNYH